MSRADRLGQAIVALCSVQLLVALEFSIANVALPDIRQDFHVGAQSLQWVLSGYALAYASVLLCGGRFADAYGPRRLLLCGLAAFTVASMAAAAAPAFGLLIALRVLQGAAAAFATPAALALVTSLTSGHRRLVALSWWGAAGSLGFALGAALGGVITDVAGWPAVFWTCAVLSAASAVMTLRWVPERRPQVSARPDAVGAVLLAGCAAAGIMVLSLAPEALSRPGTLTACLLLSTGSALALRVRHKRQQMPLLPRGFLTRRPVLHANIAGAWAAAAGGSMVYFVATFMQTVLGWPELTTGLMLVPDAAAAALGARAARPLHGRLGTVRACCVGLAGIAAGMVALTGTPMGGVPAAACILVGTCLTGFGLVLVAVITAVAAAARLNPDEHGVSGGLLVTTQQLGVAGGLALLLVVSEFATGDPLSETGIRTCLLTGAALAVAGCAVVAATGRSTPAPQPQDTVVR
ncbi:MFS transporter [Streptomyces sp. NPDC020801]|uniref:MFS transporter n=1 Tax=unclassified Streptomyces TaxID=2593676 RepID=UPI0037917300